MSASFKFDPWAVFHGDAAEPRRPPSWSEIPTVPNDGTPQWVRDILEAEALRPFFTPGQALEPTRGARCGCCKSRSFWTEAKEPKGWRCSTCHPPLGLLGEVRTVTHSIDSRPSNDGAPGQAEDSLGASALDKTGLLR
jgi:hypothetical protein